MKIGTSLLCLYQWSANHSKFKKKKKKLICQEKIMAFVVRITTHTSMVPVTLGSLLTGKRLILCLPLRKKLEERVAVDGGGVVDAHSIEVFNVKLGWASSNLIQWKTTLVHSTRLDWMNFNGSFQILYIL